jgi:hypothetical protein
MNQHREQPTHNEEFVLIAEYTPCGKNHTYHAESWPSTGEIVIEKCERQCRFRGCKAWSQTAAALRKASPVFLKLRFNPSDFSVFCLPATVRLLLERFRIISKLLRAPLLLA